MPKYVFYTDDISMDVLTDVNDAKQKIGAFALQNWQAKNFEQCMYVMKNADNIQVATHQDYANFGVKVRVTAELSEQDYIIYKLKY